MPLPGCTKVHTQYILNYNNNLEGDTVQIKTCGSRGLIYLCVFGQQVCVRVVDVAQLFHHLVPVLLPHGVLGVDPVAELSGQNLQRLSAGRQVGDALESGTRFKASNTKTTKADAIQFLMKEQPVSQRGNQKEKKRKGIFRVKKNTLCMC